jgi:tetratricopeptide (TPR) repeat protein
VLHYLIHSYDDPVHAPLGMRAARLYGEVAPEAGHALHMTSHIFVAMGMWDEVIDANRRAIDVVNRQRAARGRPAAHCGHYPLWLHYGYLQAGMREQADAALAACRDAALDPNFVSGGPMDSREGRLSSYAEMRAHQLTMAGGMGEGTSEGTNGRDSGAEGTALSGALPPGHEGVSLPADEGYRGARLLAAYGDLLAAAQRRDQEALAAAAERLRALRHAEHGEEPHEMPMPMMPNDAARAAVMAQQAEALELLAAGRRDEALRLLEEAKLVEEAMPFEFGPPVVPKPTAELLGDQLLAAGRAKEAEAAYRASLRRAPGRVQSLRGLERALAAAAQ